MLAMYGSKPCVMAAFIAVSVIASNFAEAQPGLTVGPTPQITSAVVIPETRPIGVPRPAAAIAGISPDVAATTVTVRKHSRLQARVALRRAKPWRPMLGPQPGTAAPGGGIGAQAICGANRLVADDSVSNCRIVTTYGNGGSFSCSAFKFGDNLLGTAGHCIYSKDNGGWATAVDVYCTGSVACSGEPTTHAVQMTTTPRWTASSTDVPTAWDGAVIRTADKLPGNTLTLAMCAQPGTQQVKLTGYPAQSSDPGCESSAYANSCYQYSSTDAMEVTPDGMYTSSNLDLCRGHSGSGVMTADGNSYLVAVVTGASFEPCANYFVPQINDNAGVDEHCEKAEGGVSFACLAGKLTG